MELGAKERRYDFHYLYAVFNCLWLMKDFRIQHSLTWLYATCKKVKTTNTFLLDNIEKRVQKKYANKFHLSNSRKHCNSSYWYINMHCNCWHERAWPNSFQLWYVNSKPEIQCSIDAAIMIIFIIIYLFIGFGFGFD